MDQQPNRHHDGRFAPSARDEQPVVFDDSEAPSAPAGSYTQTVTSDLAVGAKADAASDELFLSVQQVKDYCQPEQPLRVRMAMLSNPNPTTYRLAARLLSRDPDPVVRAATSRVTGEPVDEKLAEILNTPAVNDVE